MPTQIRGDNSPCATATIFIVSVRGSTRPDSQRQGPQAQGAVRRNNESISPSLTFYGFAQRAEHRIRLDISRTPPSPVHSNM